MEILPIVKVIGLNRSYSMAIMVQQRSIDYENLFIHTKHEVNSKITNSVIDQFLLLDKILVMG